MTTIEHGRPAQRHRDAADAGDARRDGRAASATTCSATTRRVNALQERIAALLGKEAALFMRQRHAEQPGRDHEPLRRGDEYIVGQMAHTYRYEGGGARGARQRPAAAARARARRLAGAGRHRGGDQARRRALRAEPLLCLENTIGGKVLPHRLPGQAAARWRSSAAWRPTSTAPGCSTPRSRSAAIRARRRARSRRRSTASRCASEGPRRAGRLGAGRLARADRARAPLAQDARRRHAPGRRAGRRGAARARPPHRSPGRRPRARATASPKGCSGLPGLTVERPQTNIVFVDLAGDRAAGLIAHLQVARRARAPASIACAS